MPEKLSHDVAHRKYQQEYDRILDLRDHDLPMISKRGHQEALRGILEEARLALTEGDLKKYNRKIEKWKYAFTRARKNKIDILEDYQE